MRQITLVSVMLIYVLFADVNVFGQEQAPAPSFAEGDFWQFKVREWDWITQTTTNLTGVYELRYSQGEIQIFEVTGDQKTEHPPADPLLALSGISKDPRYLQDLKFPLTVGKKWDHTYVGGAAGSKRRTNRTVQVRVSGIEEVNTPAGTFRAFKLQKEDWGGSSRFVTTYFYSPEMKSVIKSHYDSSLGPDGTGGKREIELIKFGSQR